MHVLVVDDSPLAARILVASLEADGHTTLVAANGRDAQALFTTHPVSAVISDWEMPGMTGPELCRAIRQQPSGRHVPFILLTSRDDQQSLIEACEAGADDLMTKPLDPDRLLLRTRSIERAQAAGSKHGPEFMSSLSRDSHPKPPRIIDTTTTHDREVA